MSVRPLYVVVEGPDGSGKSTLVSNLARLMRGRDELGGFPAWETREPGGNPLGERLRSALKDVQLQRHTPWLARRLLFEADRVAQQELVRHHVESGSHVVQDRCAVVSNHCYGAAEGSDDGTMQAIEALDRDRLMPDLVLLVDTPDRIAGGRLKLGSDAEDPAERDPGLLGAVRANYAVLVAQARDDGEVRTKSGFVLQARVLDGSASREDLAHEALRDVALYAATEDRVG